MKRSEIREYETASAHHPVHIEEINQRVPLTSNR
jgi:hypothetical protein